MVRSSPGSSAEIARDPARNDLPGETLLLIDIINAEGLIIIQTVWATTSDRRRGRRLTRFEHVTDQATLIQRLAELTAPYAPELPLLRGRCDNAACKHEGMLMERRRFGNTDLTVSIIGLGCYGMSGAYGPADDAESIVTIRRALDLGVNLLDSSASYGKGHNHRLIGEAIRGRRHEVVIHSNERQPTRW